jgi:hypothetical protein
MEYHQLVQNRSFQTVAVLKRHFPEMRVAEIGASELQRRAEALNAKAQVRNDAIVEQESALAAEHAASEFLRKMAINLPKAMEGELDRAIPAEAGLLALLAPVYANYPRTTELAQQRAQKLKSALDSVNAYLAAEKPPRGPIASAGKGIADLISALERHPGLEQIVEDRAAVVSMARSGLREEAQAVDQLNKRFFKKLYAEGRGNAAVTDALDQIDTSTVALPATLGIRSIVQGQGLHALVSYENAATPGATEKLLEWMVDGVDAGFTNSTPIKLEGNVVGPFGAAQTLKLRTRVTNGNGTRTGAVRVFVLHAPREDMTNKAE